MTIGGGLYDRGPDPEPDRHQVQDTVPEIKIKAAQREWGFWAAMVIGLWAAFQGLPLVAFWFTVVFIVVASARFMVKGLMNEIRKTWKG